MPRPPASTPNHPDRNAHLLNNRALIAINRSTAADFSGDGLAWGDWCRRLALAAMLGDEERVKAMAERAVPQNQNAIDSRSAAA